VARSCLLYAGWIRDNIRAVWRPAHPPPSLLGQVSQPLSPVASNDALHTGSSRQHRAQDWSVNRFVVSRSRTFVRRLQTPTGAAPRRLLRSPRSVVQERLLNGAIFHTDNCSKVPPQRRNFATVTFWQYFDTTFFSTTYARKLNQSWADPAQLWFSFLAAQLWFKILLGCRVCGYHWSYVDARA